MSTLETRIDTFALKIERASSKGKQDARNKRNRFKRVCKKEMSALRAEFTTNTLSTYLTSYKKRIKELGLLEELKPFLSLEDEEIREIKNHAANTISRPQRPIDSKRFMRTAVAQLKLPINIYCKKPQIAPWTLALCLLTGRRTIEVLKTGTFSEPQRGHSLLEPAGMSSVLFSGQAKTKDSENARTAPYRIPVLTPRPELIIERVAELRAHLDLEGMTNAQISQKFQSTLNAQAFRIFNYLNSTELREEFARQYPKSKLHNEDEKVTPKMLRAAYAATCWKRRSDPLIQIEPFLAEILGHTLIGESSEGYTAPLDNLTTHAYKCYQAIN